MLRCKAATIILVESETEFVNGLLSFKWRISKRNLPTAGLARLGQRTHMTANMVRNVRHAGVQTFAYRFSDNMDYG